MKAAVSVQGQVQIQDLPIPSPQADEVVLKVHASCLNRADLGIVAGKAHGAPGAHPGQGTRLGLECAGTVSAVGQSVTRFKLGDRVMCTAAGAFAEYVSVNQHRVTHLPDEAFSFDEAACLPVATRTSYAALAMLGNLQPGQAVLRQGERTRQFESVEALAADATGAPIPVRALFAWLRGQSAEAAGWQADLRQLSAGRIDAHRQMPLPTADLRIVLDK